MGENDANSEDDGTTAVGNDNTTIVGTEPRRRFLRVLGAAGALAGTAGFSVAQETGTEDGDRTTTTDEAGATTRTTAADDATPIVLGGRADYWLGLAPDAIEGQQNPALDFQTGERYRLVWMNLDGERHQWQVEDEDGSVVERTEDAQRVGATRSVAFEATDAMAQYRCEYHPEAMQGPVGRGGVSETTAAETTDETTAEETTADADGEIVDVAVGPDGEYLRFVPEEVEISVGDTVRWTAESEGHNVSAKPEAATQVELPDDAEPFASYEGSRSFMIMEIGETFEHTFTVPGTYVYVCVPHSDQGMVARVVVGE